MDLNAEQIRASALLNGQRIVSVDTGPFNTLDAIRWRLPTGHTFTTRQLRLMGHTLEIVYAPRTRPIVPFAGIASSLEFAADSHVTRRIGHAPMVADIVEADADIDEGNE